MSIVTLVLAPLLLLLLLDSEENIWTRNTCPYKVAPADSTVELVSLAGAAVVRQHGNNTTCDLSVTAQVATQSFVSCLLHPLVATLALLLAAKYRNRLQHAACVTSKFATTLPSDTLFIVLLAGYVVAVTFPRIETVACHFLRLGSRAKILAAATIASAKPSTRRLRARLADQLVTFAFGSATATLEFAGGHSGALRFTLLLALLFVKHLHSCTVAFGDFLLNPSHYCRSPRETLRVLWSQHVAHREDYAHTALCTTVICTAALRISHDLSTFAALLGLLSLALRVHPTLVTRVASLLPACCASALKIALVTFPNAAHKTLTSTPCITATLVAAGLSGILSSTPAALATIVLFPIALVASFRVRMLVKTKLQSVTEGSRLRASAVVIYTLVSFSRWNEGPSTWPLHFLPVVYLFAELFRLTPPLLLTRLPSMSRELRQTLAMTRVQPATLIATNSGRSSTCTSFRMRTTTARRPPRPPRPVTFLRSLAVVIIATLIATASAITPTDVNTHLGWPSSTPPESPWHALRSELTHARRPSEPPLSDLDEPEPPSTAKTKQPSLLNLRIGLRGGGHPERQFDSGSDSDPDSASGRGPERDSSPPRTSRKRARSASPPWGPPTGGHSVLRETDPLYDDQVDDEPEDGLDHLIDAPVPGPYVPGHWFIDPDERSTSSHPSFAPSDDRRILTASEEPVRDYSMSPDPPQGFSGRWGQRVAYDDVEVTPHTPVSIYDSTDAWIQGLSTSPDPSPEAAPTDESNGPFQIVVRTFVRHPDPVDADMWRSSVTVEVHAQDTVESVKVLVAQKIADLTGSESFPPSSFNLWFGRTCLAGTHRPVRAYRIVQGCVLKAHPASGLRGGSFSDEVDAFVDLVLTERKSGYFKPQFASASEWHLALYNQFDHLCRQKGHTPVTLNRMLHSEISQRDQHKSSDGWKSLLKQCVDPDNKDRIKHSASTSQTLSCQTSGAPSPANSPPTSPRRCPLPAAAGRVPPPCTPVSRIETPSTFFLDLVETPAPPRANSILGENRPTATLGRVNDRAPAQLQPTQSSQLAPPAASATPAQEQPRQKRTTTPPPPSAKPRQPQPKTPPPPREPAQQQQHYRKTDQQQMNHDDECFKTLDEWPKGNQASGVLAVHRIIRGYAMSSDPVAKSAIMHALLNFPKCYLRVMTCAMSSRERSRASNLQLSGVIIEQIGAPAHASKDQAEATKRRGRKVRKQLYRGHIGKACATMCQEQLPEVPVEEAKACLTKLHPFEELGPQHLLNHPDPCFQSCDHEEISKLTRQLCRGAAAGRTGWTEELLLPIALDRLTRDDFAAIIVDIANGEVDGTVRHRLTQCRGISLPKPAGGVRPIAIGEPLLKIAATLAVTSMSSVLLDHFAPLQFGVGYEGGAEHVSHCIRRGMREKRITVAIDATNAFNSPLRSKIAEVLRSNPKFTPLYRLWDLCYATPSQVYFRQGDSKYTINSTRGTRQGDVLGALFFSLVIHPTLVQAKKQFPELDIYAYIDDVTVQGDDQERVRQCVDFIRDSFSELGMDFNESKCEWFSTTFPCPYPSWCHRTDAIKILGVFHGEKDDIIRAKVLEHIKKRNSLLFLRLLDMKGLAAIIILGKCGVPRLNFTLRAQTPSTSSEAAYWFRDSLTEVWSTKADVEVTAISKTIALLPVDMGGMGWTDPTRIVGAAYNASVAMSDRDQNVPDQQAATQYLMLQLRNRFKENYPERMKHLDDASKKGNGRFLTYCKGIVLGSTAEDEQRTSAALRIRMNLPRRHLRPADQGSPGTAFTCPGCGFSGLEDHEINPHLAGCAVITGRNSSSAHAYFKRTLAFSCRSRAIGVAAKEPTGYGTYRCTSCNTLVPDDGLEQHIAESGCSMSDITSGHLSRPDLEIYLGGKAYVIDVSITGVGRSAKSATAAINSRVAQKNKLYKRAVEARDAIFVPFVVTPNGTFNDEAEALMKKIVENGVKEKDALSAITAEIKHGIIMGLGMSLNNAERQRLPGYAGKNLLDITVGLYEDLVATTLDDVRDEERMELADIVSQFRSGPQTPLHTQRAPCEGENLTNENSCRFQFPTTLTPASLPMTSPFCADAAAIAPKQTLLGRRPGDVSQHSATAGSRSSSN